MPSRLRMCAVRALANVAGDSAPFRLRLALAQRGLHADALPSLSGHLYADAQLGFRLRVRRIVKRCRGGFVVKAHRLLYHSTLGTRAIEKRKMPSSFFACGCVQSDYRFLNLSKRVRHDCLAHAISRTMIGPCYCSVRALANVHIRLELIA